VLALARGEADRFIWTAKPNLDRVREAKHVIVDDRMVVPRGTLPWGEGVDPD
jgi:hypothetical protein